MKRTESGESIVDIVPNVREAFRRLQQVPKRYTFMIPGLAGMKTALRLIQDTQTSRTGEKAF